MKEENLDIIEFDNKEYALILKFNVNNNLYFLLNEILNDELTDNVIVLKEQAGFLLSIDDEKEKAEVEKYLLNEYKNDTN